MTFGELATILQGDVLQASDSSFHQVVTDSRTIQHPSEALFFAQKGPNHDGHSFISSLYDLGVRLFIVEEFSESPGPDAGIMKVDKSLKSLQKLAQYHRKQHKYPVIAITGSNGKTTVKEWLATFLEEHFQIIKSPKSYNSQLGVPLSVMEMSDAHNLAILEAGISKTGEMKQLARIIEPTIGLFTNIGSAHDEGFDSVTEKIKEKASLFSSCQTIICRRDHQEVWEHLRKTYGSRVKSWSYSHPEADIQYKLNRNVLRLIAHDTNWSFTLPFDSEPQVENLLHAITTGLLLGVSPEELNLAIPKIRDIDMRLTLKKGANHCYLVDDTYNNDPAGLKVALNTLSQLRQKEKKTVILSDILQSGLAARTLYEQVNKLLEQYDINRLIGIGKEISWNKEVFTSQKSFYQDTESFLANMPVFEDEIILIKGARQFQLEQVVNVLEEKHHGTSLTIHFEKVLHNLNRYRSLLGGTKLMVMVKASGYGGGSYELANFLQYHQVDYLGVAYVDEGIDLRKNGIETPIMVMNPDWDSLPVFATYHLEPEIYSLEMLRHFIQLNLQIPIHLKIETGMNRLGLAIDDLNQVLELLNLHQIRVQSIFTHLAASEDANHDAFTRQQIDRYHTACSMLKEGLDYAPIRHVLNSSGITRWPEFQFEMVRLGIGLYGIDPAHEMDLTPVSSFRTQISQVKSIKAGETVGYGRAGKANGDMEIATIPVGYADGYRRSFGREKGYVLVNRQKAKVVGNVCMDMTMIDVTDLNVKKGDTVTLFGEKPTVNELAAWGDTIPYEILTSISSRVKRVYSWD